ncbi:MAG: type II secretion system protein [Limisphaerales bacterium]
MRSRFQIHGLIPAEPRVDPRGFTLIELLVVMAIIAILASMLLPVLGKAQAQGQTIHCLNNERQLILAVQLYHPDNADTLPPIQDRMPEGFETSWRSYLFPYVGKSPQVFDCPAEKEETYASGRPVNSKTPSQWLIGQPLNGEILLPSGIGAVNAHWAAGGAPPVRAAGRLRKQSLPRLRHRGTDPDDPVRRRSQRCLRRLAQRPVVDLEGVGRRQLGGVQPIDPEG